MTDLERATATATTNKTKHNGNNNEAVVAAAVVVAETVAAVKDSTANLLFMDWMSSAVLIAGQFTNGCELC